MIRTLALVLSLLPAAPLLAGPSGTLEVIDGDTFDIGEIRVRLFGVDAPEADQSCGTGAGAGSVWACGAWVTQEVTLRFANRAADCTVVDTDRYGRSVARCTVDGRDIGEQLVSEGLATAYRQYSLDYVTAEKSAQIARRGIWRGEVEDPASWRRRARTPQASAQAPQAASGDCVIKGNISSGGRIYHMPTDNHYGRTRIDTGKGERWFCSETEARNAGWRRARG